MFLFGREITDKLIMIIGRKEGRTEGRKEGRMNGLTHSFNQYRNGQPNLFSVPDSERVPGLKMATAGLKFQL
jgi:hypothetical protein